MHLAVGINRQGLASFVGKTRFDYLIVVEDESTLRALRPDFPALAKVPARGVIVTCRADDKSVDFVSRFFAPAAGINADPVTGSAHCALAPFWQSRLQKDRMIAYQASARGGTVYVRLVGDRVILGGEAVTVLAGELTL